MLPVAPRAQSKLVAGGFTGEDYPSTQARRIIQERFGIGSVSIVLIVSHHEWNPYSPQFIDSLQQALSPLLNHPNITGIRTHIDDPSFISNSGDAVLAELSLDLEIEEALTVLDEISERLDPGPLSIVMTGAPPLYRDIVVTSGEDLQRGETIAFPLATITLLIVFGTVVAAFMPVLVGGASVAIALGAIYYIATWQNISILSFNIITLLGIGISIDYSLLYVSRFREELATGKTVRTALADSHSTAGIAILFSGFTSVVGLAGLLLFDLNVLDSVGIGAVIVIAIAILSALTLMPAILAIIGHRINRWRIIPIRTSRISFWSPIANRVMQHPVLVLVPAIGFLLILALPVRNLQLGTVDGGILPEHLESRQGFNILQQDFGWDVRTDLIVLYSFEGDPFQDDNLAELYSFGKALETIEGVEDVNSFVNVRKTLGLEDYRLLYQHPEAIYDATLLRTLNDTLRDGAAIFIVSSPLHPFTPQARKLVADVRSFSLDPGSTAFVDGGAAALKDMIDSLYGRFPYVAGAAMLLTFISLMILFRSIVIPLKAVILNIFSIIASYGALVWVFQEGNLSGLLNFQPLGVIDATMPIVLFAVLFGISMDYEIFLLSRVREAYLRTRSNRQSVVIGLQRSGSIITGAGAILVVVGASFVMADLVTVKAIGFGLALAIFIDVTIVRILIAPALMRLLGNWNWWLPNWLDKIIPHIHFGDTSHSDDEPC